MPNDAWMMAVVEKDAWVQFSEAKLQQKSEIERGKREKERKKKQNYEAMIWCFSESLLIA